LSAIGCTRTETDTRIQHQYDPYEGIAYPDRRPKWMFTSGDIGVVSNNGSDSVSVLDLVNDKTLGTAPVLGGDAERRSDRWAALVSRALLTGRAALRAGAVLGRRALRAHGRARPWHVAAEIRAVAAHHPAAEPGRIADRRPGVAGWAAALADIAVRVGA